MKIVFASHNAGKIHELQALLAEFHIDIIPQTDLNVSEVPETGLTFVENALIKARHACQATGLPAIADDSGLAVSALRGAPGIYSARYAGEKATSTDNIQKLLEQLKDVPDEERQASFHCVLVYLNTADDPTPLICHATWHGVILTNPQGKNGFGYDPVFFDMEQNQCAAELPLAIKNKISHRGKALRLLMKQLSEKINI
jgi:XTP/dITP diphosphohydrolase